MRKWAVALVLAAALPILMILTPALGEGGLKSKILVFAPSGCGACEEQVSLLRQKYGGEVDACALESPACQAVYNGLYQILLPHYGASRHVPFTVVRSSQGLVGAIVLGPLSSENWDKTLSDVEGLSPTQVLVVDVGRDAIVLVELDESTRQAIEKLFTEQVIQPAAPQPPASLPSSPVVAQRSDYFMSNIGFLILAILALAILMYMESSGPRTDKSPDSEIA